MAFVDKFDKSKRAFFSAGQHLPGGVNPPVSLRSCFFTDKPIKNFAEVWASNITFFQKFFAKMLNNGIYPAPSAFEVMFISTAHSKQDIAKTIKAAQNTSS